MAWALQFDGVDDYLVLSDPHLIDFNNNIEVEFKLRYPDRTTIILGTETLTSSFIAWRSNGILRIYDGSSLIDVNLGLVFDSIPKIRVVINGGSADFYVDDAFHSNRDLSSLSVFNFNSVGKWGSNTYYIEGLFEYFKVADLTTSANSFNLDATASNHGTGQPVLTDTIGGNDAQGQNFPTDGSAWVDLGGGATSYPFNIDALASNANLTNVALRYDRTLNTQGLTASGQFNDIAFDYNQSLTLALDSLQGSATNGAVDLLANRLINIDGLATNGSFSDVVLQYNQQSVFPFNLDSLSANGQYQDINLAYHRQLAINSLSSSASFSDIQFASGLKFNLNSLTSTATFNEVQLQYSRIFSIEPLTTNGQFKSVALDYSGFVEQKLTNYSVGYKPDAYTAQYKQDDFSVKFGD